MDSKYDVPRKRRSGRGLDWQRISRWSLLGAVVMLLWLLYPTARCSWQGFKDIPLTDMDQQSLDARQADQQRIEQSEGFLSEWSTEIQICYDWYPPTQEASWKKRLLVLFAALALITWLMDRLWVRGQRADRSGRAT